MNEALIGLLTGVAGFVVLAATDSLTGRTRQRLRRAELRVKTLQQQLSGTSKALNREKSRGAAKLVDAESRYQEEIIGLNAKIGILTAENKRLQNLLDQKWKEATAGGNTENG